MYRLLFHLVLRRIDPEVAHGLAKRASRVLRGRRPGPALAARWLGRPDPMLEVRALGRSFATPLGAAAGLDKDGTWYQDLIALGFGFVEVGTVTAQPQPGNPRPRIARVVEDRALVNWMGFPNPGARSVASALSGRPPELPVGVNVGKTRVVALEDASADYRESIRELAPLADYLVVNVSSPNTPGLRELQSPKRLRELVGQIRDELDGAGRRVPLLVKIAPDLSDAELDAVAALALELELDGIVAVNTTVDRGGLTQAGVEARGGVSGAPLARRAEEVLRRLRASTGPRLTLISVGGIESGQDVWERLRAGATLVQAYTGLVYGGPAWPRRINRELVQLLRQSGHASIQDVIGQATAPTGRQAPVAQ